MGSKWPTVPLGHLIEPGRVLTYGVVQPGSPVHDGVPIVRVADIRDGRVSTSGALRISPAIEAPYGRSRLRGGELLLTVVGTVGETVVAPNALAGWNTARGVAVIPVRNDVGSMWVRLALQGSEARSAIDSRLNTTVQPTLNLDDVARLPIPMPPTEARQRILRHIGALDDKIELNRLISQTLESVARALFKSWFVDFDPVRAKAERREPYLPIDLADSFPSAFEESELGPKPTGWRVAQLSSLSRLMVGGDWGDDSASERSPTAVRCLRGVDLHAIRTSGWSNAPIRYISESSVERRKLAPSDVIIEASGECGRSLACSQALLSLYGQPIVYSNFCRRIRTESAGEALLVEHVLNELVRTGEMKTYVTGTAMPNLDVAGLLSSVSVVVPAKRVLEVWAEVADLARCQRLSTENAALAAARDFLLPELISGGLELGRGEPSTNTAPG